MAHPQTGLRLVDQIYATIQLFTLESGNPERIPCPLTFELARYLAPLTHGFGHLSGHEPIHPFAHTRQTKVRNLSDHFIIVGGNERALALAPRPQCLRASSAGRADHGRFSDCGILLE